MILIKDTFIEFFSILKKHRKIFNDDESLFIVKTSMKFALIPLFTVLILAGVVYIILNYNLIFFQMNGFVTEDLLQEAYYDFFINSFSEKMFILIVLFWGLYLVGIYVAQMMLRPFRIIGNYCEQVVSGNKKAIYDPDFFTDLKFLTQFSEYFFNMIDNGVLTRVVDKIKIPLKYTRVHSPVFERGFFLQFMFFIIIISLTSSILIFSLVSNLNEQLVELSMKTLQLDVRQSEFLYKQIPFFETIVWGAVFIQSIFYILLSVNLYQKVSSPAFGVFATMRSFLKGQKNNRIHLVGYYYIRPECRKINKYLDYIQHEIENRVDQNV